MSSQKQRRMIVDHIKRDKIGGLVASESDLLKDRHALAQFQQNCQASLAYSFKAINNHQVKISKSALQIFDTPCKTTDMLANMVSRKRSTQIVAEDRQGLVLFSADLEYFAWILISGFLLISNSFADYPTSYGTLHPDYSQELLVVILSQYYKEMFGGKGLGASGVATPLALKFRRSIEPPPPVLSSSDGCDDGDVRPQRQPYPAQAAEGGAGERAEEADPTPRGCLPACEEGQHSTGKKL